jgi:carboxyl-terminal processing protease
LRKYPDFDDYNKKFFIADSEFDTFISKAEEEFEVNKEQLDPNVDFLKLMIKALLARNLYDNNAYFEVLWVDDHDINKALEVIGRDDLYSTFGQVLEQQK